VDGDDGFVVCVDDSFPGSSTTGVAWASSLSSMRTINLGLEKKRERKSQFPCIYFFPFPFRYFILVVIVTSADESGGKCNAGTPTVGKRGAENARYLGVAEPEARGHSAGRGTHYPALVTRSNASGRLPCPHGLPSFYKPLLPLLAHPFRLPRLWAGQVKRAAKSRFMAGAHVFPGGILEDGDSDPLWRDIVPSGVRSYSPPLGAPLTC